MYRKKIIGGFGLIVCLLLCVILPVQAQYKVSGGEGTPLLAVDDTRNRLQVYLVYGMNNIELSFTGTTTNHTWYRYKQKALEGEVIPCTQNGNTSTVSNPEAGYGYYVEESGILSRYIWLIDYKQYEFVIRDLSVSEAGDHCGTFRLTGDVDMPLMIYYTPIGGMQLLPRSFTVSYLSLEWSDEDKYFKSKEELLTIDNPFESSLPAPLCDTYIQLSGDSFAEHFDKGKTFVTEEYMAVAIEAHADTIVVIEDPLNMSAAMEGLSAPVTITFKGYANDPVASLYIWKIYKDEGAEEPDYLIRYTGEEVEYTFREAGRYIAELEVADRSSSCSDETQMFELQIAESFLRIPNAFSPGTSPGINDEFRVSYKSLVRFQAWVFNRWGTQLFHWSDPAMGWDGKFKGKYVPPGVYFYVIEAEGSDGMKYKRSGDINLLRSKTINDEIIENEEAPF